MISHHSFKANPPIRLLSTPLQPTMQRHNPSGSVRTSPGGCFAIDLLSPPLPRRMHPRLPRSARERRHAHRRVLPHGSGKTTIFTHLIDRLPSRSPNGRRPRSHHSQLDRARPPSCQCGHQHVPIEIRRNRAGLQIQSLRTRRCDRGDVSDAQPQPGATRQVDPADFK